MAFLLFGRRNYRASIPAAIILALLLNWGSSFGAERSKVRIVYLGEKQHDDPDLVTLSHHRVLEPLLGSKKAARDSMVYSYRHGFSGFAAKLTDSHVKKIADLPGVVQVTPDHVYTTETTRTWDYLGLTPSLPENLLNDTNMGEGIIIGIFDTGLWPESEVFGDKGLGPIPARWKGHCQSGERFNATTDCNNKIIGAKYFVDGLLAQLDAEDFNRSRILDYLSPRDYHGHGTHVSSIAAGSFVANVSYKGLARGTVRGGAPRAHIAMYKVCWNLRGRGRCSFADVLKAADEAIRDGVDVMSLSIVTGLPLFADIDMRDGFAVGAFHAVTKGIPVIFAAGNSGPSAQTVTNTAPWFTTVAATTLDRSYPTVLTLGNNITILGQALYTGAELGLSPLVYPEDPENSNETFYGACNQLSLNSNATIAGKVVLCFATLSFLTTLNSTASRVKLKDGLGVIVARNPGELLSPCSDDFPCITVDYELGTDILFYIRSTSSPVVKISPSKTLIGKPVATKVAIFSSRGPSSTAPAILKPDIAAPGRSILAAIPGDDAFGLGSGTSMATPAVSGIIALLKAFHPDWSPAAFRSAIVTTAWRTDPSGEPIFAEGFPRKLADPFDYGGGLVNPEKAAKPGLIYDMGNDDYVLYMCAAGFNNTAISQLIGNVTVCPSPKPSVLDLNLPSITIPNLKDSVTVTRTVTNVGPVDSEYRAVIEPLPGINVVVTPETLVFNSTTKKISFRVKVSTEHKVNTGYYFGSLTWTDGAYDVTIPLSVRTQFLQRYNDN